MKISKKNLSTLIERYLFEADEGDASVEIELQFANDLVIVREYSDGRREIVSCRPDIFGREISRENPLPFDDLRNMKWDDKKTAFEYFTMIVDEKRNSSGSVADEKKYEFEPEMGYPVILCNVDDKSSAEGFASNFPESMQKKIIDSIPEGHVFLIVVDPRTRVFNRFDFGSYDASRGGKQSCIDQNTGISDKGLMGFRAIGSFVYKSLGIPAKLEKKGSNYVLSDGGSEVIEKQKSSMGKDVDYVVIDGCLGKNVNKAISQMKVNDCAEYNLLPASALASISDSLAGAYNFAKDLAFGPDDEMDASDAAASSTIKQSTGDNCATMAYKMAYLAKNGTQIKSVGSLGEAPATAVEYAKKNLV